MPANSKKKSISSASDDTTLTCECGMVVKVGTGGQANLLQHQKSTKHKNAMQKIRPDERAEKFRAFFSSATVGLGHLAVLPFGQRSKLWQIV